MTLAPAWTTFDLHRLVAHYLSVRFPICLALNKIDAFPDSSHRNNSNDDTQKKNHGSNNNNCEVLKKNVIDPTGGDGGRGIVQECRSQAISRGELAVPVSAFAENWNILKQAHALIQSQAVTQTKTTETNTDVNQKIKAEKGNIENKVEEIFEESEGEKGKKAFPLPGSRPWRENEAVLDRVRTIWKTTGN